MPTGIWGRHANFWGFHGLPSAINLNHTKFQATLIPPIDNRITNIIPSSKHAAKIYRVSSVITAEKMGDIPGPNRLRIAIENIFQKGKDCFR
jgi:CO/xanthine dehydrogenase Mo-binding subunit